MWYSGVSPFIFDGMPGIVMIFFVIIISLIVITIIRDLKEWNKNNHSPILTVEAKVVSKRMNVSHHNTPIAGDATGAHGFTTHTNTNYYVTFEVESGDRMEFHISKAKEYGMLVEGDRGKLTFQGTRYLGFERII